MVPNSPAGPRDWPRHAARNGDGDYKPPSLVEVAKTAAEDLIDLVTAQIKLARLELATDLRDAFQRAARLALFIPLVLIGYVFGMAGIASWLSSYLGWTLALALVAGLQLVVGGAGALMALRRLKATTSLLQAASAEAANNIRLTIAAVSEPTRLRPHG